MQKEGWPIGRGMISGYSEEIGVCSLAGYQERGVTARTHLGVGSCKENAKV